MGSTESKITRHHNNQDSPGRGRRASAHLFRYRSNQTSKSKQSSSDDDHQSTNSSGKENSGGNRTLPALSHLQQQGNQIMSRIKRQQQQAQQQKQQKQQQKQIQQEETAPNDKAASANSESSESVTTSKHSGQADSTAGWDTINRDAIVLAAAHTASAASNGSNTGLSSAGSGTTVKEAVQKIVDEVHPSPGNVSNQQKPSPSQAQSPTPSTLQKRKQYSTSYQPQTTSERILMDLFTLPESDAQRRKERDR